MDFERSEVLRIASALENICSSWERANPHEYTMLKPVQDYARLIATFSAYDNQTLRRYPMSMNVHLALLAQPLFSFYDMLPRRVSKEVRAEAEYLAQTPFGSSPFQRKNPTEFLTAYLIGRLREP